MNQTNPAKKTIKTGQPPIPTTQAMVGVEALERIDKIDESMTTTGILIWVVLASWLALAAMWGVIVKLFNSKLNKMKTTIESIDKTTGKDEVKQTSEYQHLQNEITALKLKEESAVLILTQLQSLVDVKVDGVPVLYKIGDIMSVLNDVNKALQQVGNALGKQGIINQGVAKTMEKLDGSAVSMTESVSKLTEFLMKQDKKAHQEGSG